MKAFLLIADLSTVSLHAQPEGLWQGYDGEWGHVSRQVIALAEATPPEYFAWRPALGVRSTSPHLENAVKYNPRSVGTRWQESVVAGLNGQAPNGGDIQVNR